MRASSYAYEAPRDRALGIAHAVAGLGTAGLLSRYGYAELGPVVAIAWFAAFVTLIVILFRSAGAVQG